jgi:hypothetical protein
MLLTTHTHTHTNEKKKRKERVAKFLLCCLTILTHKLKRKVVAHMFMMLTSASGDVPLTPDDQKGVGVVTGVGPVDVEHP